MSQGIDGERPSSAVRAAPRKLCLYVAGSTPRSLRAMGELRALVEDPRGQGWTLEVVDVLSEPALALQDSVWVTPTLVAQTSAGERRAVGVFGDVAQVLTALGLVQA